jgi:hypothetical protein
LREALSDIPSLGICFGFRVSDFGLLSAFGFRVSDLLLLCVRPFRTFPPLEFVSDFGFRPSAFVRPSDFGFRISHTGMVRARR